MEIIQAIVYGAIQGLTEWLPVSSTAHLRLVPVATGWADPGAAFTAAIQLGTLFAVLVYFWKDLKSVLRDLAKGARQKEARSTSGFRLGIGMVAGSIPIIVAGLAFKDRIENDWRSLYIVASALIVMGIVLELADRFGKQDRELAQNTVRDLILIGFWQAVALIPGASRSGSSIAGARMLGFDRSSAARFSFLLATPSVLAAGVYSIYSHRESFGGAMLPAILIANVVSFFVGWATIAGFMKFVSRTGSTWFVAYRIALGCILLILLQSGRLDPNVGAPIQFSEHSRG